MQGAEGGRRCRTRRPHWHALWPLLLVVADASGQGIDPLLADASVSARDDHIDLALEFRCSLRYVAHQPATESDTVRIVLQPGGDCGLGAGGQFALERLLPPDDVGLVRRLELLPGVTGGAELIVSFNRVERFLMVPTAGQRGLRLRVLRRGGAGARLSVDDSSDFRGTLSVNLESSESPIDAGRVQQARDSLGTRAFVSEADVEGVHWFRLRAGPFTSRAAAEAVLRKARLQFPRAWLAIDDEAADAVEPGSDPVPAGPRQGGPPVAETRADPALDGLLKQAQDAARRRRGDEAVALLTRILASTDYRRRVEAQELLGLVRERKGQLTHAKAEYEEFLRRYPEDPASDRVQRRLQALRLVNNPARVARGGAGATEGWTLNASAAELFRADDAKVDAGLTPGTTVRQEVLLTDLNVVARRADERYPLLLRASGGYVRGLQSQGSGTARTRISSAYLDVQDRERGMGLRVGRQARGMPGLLGTFDGVLGSWHGSGRWGLSAVAGLPVDNLRGGPDPDRRFVGLATDFRLGGGWDAGAFVMAQQYLGQLDREAIGGELRYFGAGRSAAMLVDYDVHFAELNHVMLLGSLVLPARWTLTADLSRQRSPQLSLRNALVRQDQTFAGLQQLLTLTEIEQLALDRSVVLSQLSLTASRPLGEDLQFLASALAYDFGGLASTVDPLNPAPVPAGTSGRETAFTAELQKNGFLRAGDVASLSVRVQQGGFADVQSLGLASRLPLGGAWRLLGRVRVDRRAINDGSLQWLYLPSVRIDRYSRSSLFEFEVGAEMGDRSGAGFDESSRRLFLSVGYRLMLDRAWK